MQFFNYKYQRINDKIQVKKCEYRLMKMKILTLYLSIKVAIYKIMCNIAPNEYKTLNSYVL